MKKNGVRAVVFGILLALATGLVVYGIADGGFRDVKNKAIRICNECIGIG
ncbi:MAG: hypothetical protein IJ796_10215 [Lachnospiraceae bacterium]|nr:hypothetical protein [Lachnospiraceae bacterium]